MENCLRGRTGFVKKGRSAAGRKRNRGLLEKNRGRTKVRMQKSEGR